MVMWISCTSHMMPCGCVAVSQLNKPGRLDTDDVPTLQNVAGVMDFVFDPFNDRRLVVGIYVHMYYVH